MSGLDESSTLTGVASGLTALASQALRGEPCPRVTLLTATGLIQGIPSSRAAFLDARAGAVQDALKDDVGRRELNRRQTTIEDLAQPLLSRLDQASVSPDHIYLAPAGLLPVSGFSLSMPAVEVNLRHVIAWWLGKAEIHERKSSGSSMAFFIPLD